MTKEGKSFTSEGEKIPVNGVGVMIVKKNQGDGVVEGRFEIILERYDLADEFLARGIQKHFNKNGADTSLVFHPDSWMAEDARTQKKNKDT